MAHQFGFDSSSTASKSHLAPYINPDSEHHMSETDQVLIPFTRGDRTLGCLGPITSLSRAIEYESFFPNLKHTTSKSDEDPSPWVDEPIVMFREKIPPNYFTKKHRLFRAYPFYPTTTYLVWLDKIRAVKGDFWKLMGIFNLIQLSQALIYYNTLMLWAILYFWNKTTNNFHLRYVMTGPTLYELAIMTGLQLTREFLVPTTHPSG